mmetsp:Transcript_5001/g.8529  ORF Transcript_5001/g.8529 Transcript_5001/m.8529 type:complete len:160 (-) Transcript_5001:59-538(-)
MNGFHTFLNEKSELPRLSILDNYKQIMRIMTKSYIKGSEYENKFKNRMEKDIINDEEYQRFKEEETNTKKMSTILKSLNAPFRRSSGFPSAGQRTAASIVHGSQQKSKKGLQSEKNFDQPRHLNGSINSSNKFYAGEGHTASMNNSILNQDLNNNASNQ